MSARAAPALAIPPSTVGAATLAAIADRLEAVLDHETDALQRNRPCDLAEITGRKRQGLLELSRYMHRQASGAEPDAARDRLGALATKLERNRLALDVQIRAVREVSEVIARTLREAESDGTYSMAAGRP